MKKIPFILFIIIIALVTKGMADQKAISGKLFPLNMAFIQNIKLPELPDLNSIPGSNQSANAEPSQVSPQIVEPTEEEKVNVGDLQWTSECKNEVNSEAGQVNLGKHTLLNSHLLSRKLTRQGVTTILGEPICVIAETSPQAGLTIQTVAYPVTRDLGNNLRLIVSYKISGQARNNDILNGHELQYAQ